jgi:hypothetical protein
MFVGTPTWQYISFLSPPLISATLALLNSSLHSALAKGPFLVPQKRDLISKPCPPNFPTHQWQSRLISRNLDKRGHLLKPGINQRSHQAQNAPSQEETAQKNQEEIAGTGTSRKGYWLHTSRNRCRWTTEGVDVVCTTEGVSLSVWRPKD